ncbi:thiamine diphosphokinase [Lawsonibacter sp. OA9]|uniref:thiamine diphosphokinase n=1 Tax=Oscillospiraceae TaxID=216572 RepID=UPI001F053929|nr:thiamine diphosphokinase [Lawsonibacter sp. OA9]MCH1978297.1 thiamine diphosphokinase [Lawsonibacter sp. OA9]MCH1982290.1 thiamine diphosphokinase [Ruminococcus sp. OA3]
MNTLIISGGNINSDLALDFMEKQKPDYIIAADRGLLFAWKHKIIPDYIVGDFDSVPSDVLQEYRSLNRIPIREYNPVKDATDTQIALEKAISHGSSRIWLLGATGTRLDHTLGNIYSLKPALEAGIPAYILDEYNRISLVSGEIRLKREEQYGKYVSFLPLGEQAEGLTLEGFKYPLKDYTLKNDSGLGVSNEITADEAYVSMETGILIMIQSHD